MGFRAPITAVSYTHLDVYKRQVYVMADMAGDLESPFYAISRMSDSIPQLKIPAGYTLTEEYTQQPVSYTHLLLNPFLRLH